MFLLCAAVCGAIMSSNPWIKIVSMLYLAYFAIAIIVGVVSGDSEPAVLIVPALLVLLGMYAYDVHHMFDPKERYK